MSSRSEVSRGTVRDRRALGSVASDRFCGVLAVVVVLLLAAGCARLPTSSSPQALGTVANEQPRPVAPHPVPGQEPESVVRNFLLAGIDPFDSHAAARAFLTPDAAADWNDAGTMIVDKVDVVEDSRTTTEMSYTVRANRVGSLAADGRYQSENGQYQSTVTLSRVDNEWRVDTVSDGTILERSQFRSAYTSKSIYFLDQMGRLLVPDPRWVNVVPEQTVHRIVELLLAGPNSTLAPSVSRPPAGVTLIGEPTRADGTDGPVEAGLGGGGVRLDFAGLGPLSGDDRTRFAAQLIWTLARAEILGPYQLLADGVPIDPAREAGWTTDDVAAFDPAADLRPDIGLHALVKGALATVDESGTVTPVRGYFGAEGSNLTSASLSRDGSLIAGVWDTGQSGSSPVDVLVVGSYGGNDALPVAQGTTIGRPSWQSDGNAVWAVVDSERVIRAVTNPESGAVSVVDVDASALTALGGPITELRLSRDGVRAAMIVDGAAYIALVTTDASGRYLLRDPRPAAVGYGRDAISIDWAGANSVVIARAAGEVPVIQAAIDGSGVDALPSLSVGTPLVTVEASPNRIFVADARSVFSLDTTLPAGERFWYQVPGLVGGAVVPVLPG